MAFTDTASLPYLYLTVEGLGPTTDAAGTAVAYRLSTFDPGFAGFPTGTWRPYLRVLPSHVENTLDPATCEVTNSAITFDLIEGSQSVFLTDLFATRNRARVGRLAARALAAAGTIDVTRIIGGAPAVNDVCWIGREALRITAVAAGGGVADPKTGVASDRLTVTRARYDTTAHIHDVGSNFGDDEVRYRPHYLRGREVALWINFQGDAVGSAVVIWRGLLDGLELVTDGDEAGAAWRVRCRGVAGLLDTIIGHHLWVGRMAWRALPERPGDIGQVVRATVGAGDDLAANLPDAESPLRPAADSSNGGYVDVGGVLYDYDLPAAPNPADGASVVLDITAVNAQTPSEIAGETAVREVFPVDKALTHSRFAPNPTGAPPARASDHPIDIFLCLALSTGDGNNVGAGQTSYDVLPSRIGAGVPVARFDILAWEAMRDRTGEVRVPRLVIGHAGPFNLLEFATEEMLGPLGVAPVEDEDGLITPVRISDVSPADAVVSLTEQDVIPGSEVWDWSMDDQVSLTTWEMKGGPYAPEEFTQRMISAAARVRYPRSRNKTLKFESHGLDPKDNAALALAEGRQAWVLRHFVEPPPHLKLVLTWRHFRLALGSVVRLTHSSLPNPSTGTRGLFEEDFIVVGKRMAFDGLGQGDGGGVEVDLFWVGLDGTLGALWAPAAQVATGDAGAGNPITVGENAFTDGEARGSVVADDTDGFLAGAATGDFVMLCDSDLARLSANTPRITAKTATTLTLSDVFRDGGGVEVPRGAGYLIIFVSDTGGVAPTAAWTAHMQESAAQADATNETIGTLARVNHYLD